MRVLIAFFSFFVLGAQAQVKLSAHKAIYELSLHSAEQNSGISRATGRFVYELTGNACDGYITTQRVLVDYMERDMRVISDLTNNSFEGGDAKILQFSSTHKINNQVVEQISGKAERVGQELRVNYTQPKSEQKTVIGTALFPNQHMIASIVAAQKGDKIFSVPFFDGSKIEGKYYDTLTLIGKPILGEENIEKPAMIAALKGKPRFPLNISYAETQNNKTDSAVSFSIRYESYENGIGRNLFLQNPMFTLHGVLKELTLQDEGECKEKK